jgi:hypothetical protein
MLNSLGEVCKWYICYNYYLTKGICSDVTIFMYSHFTFWAIIYVTFVTMCFLFQLALSSITLTLSIPVLKLFLLTSILITS